MKLLGINPEIFANIDYQMASDIKPYVGCPFGGLRISTDNQYDLKSGEVQTSPVKKVHYVSDQITVIETMNSKILVTTIKGQLQPSEN